MNNKEKKKILVVKGQSAYEVLRVATDQIAKGFINKGYDVDVIDTLCTDANYFLHKAFEDYAFIFSMQGVGLNLELSDGTKFIDIIDKPFVGWIFDDFIIHHERTKYCDREKAFILTIDGSVKKYNNMYTDIEKHVLFMPHGCFENNGAMFEKDIDILFPGSLSCLPQLEELDDWSEEDRNLTIALICKTIDEPELSIRQVLLKISGNISKELVDVIMLEKFDIFNYVQNYLRIYFRNLLLAALIRSGLSVHIVGNDDSDNNYPDNVTLHGELDIEDNIKLMNRAKIVINPIPNIYEEGFHERIFMGFMSKAIVFTPEHSYQKEHIADRVEYIDLNNINDFVLNVKRILDNYENQQTRLDKNYIYAKENHTFEKRGEKIAEMYEVGVF